LGARNGFRAIGVWGAFGGGYADYSSDSVGVQLAASETDGLEATAIYLNANRTAHLAYGRSAKFVNDLRVVNEIQSRCARTAICARIRESTLPQTSHKSSLAAAMARSPRLRGGTQNRANDLTRHVQMLAIALPSLAAGSADCDF